MKTHNDLLMYLSNNNLIKKYLCSYTWLSGSSTKVFPIVYSMVGKDITIQINTDKNMFTRFIKKIEQNFDCVKYGYFDKGDGSCPARLVFKLK